MLLIAILTACSPQKRLVRIIKNHPEAIAAYMDTVIYTRADTFIYDKDVIIPGRVDSFYLPQDTSIIKGKDTFWRKGNTFGYKIAPDTMRLTDTIYREIQVKGKVVKIKEPLNTAFGVILLLIILGIFIYSIRKK